MNIQEYVPLAPLTTTTLPLEGVGYSTLPTITGTAQDQPGAGFIAAQKRELSVNRHGNCDQFLIDVERQYQLGPGFSEMAVQIGRP